MTTTIQPGDRVAWSHTDQVGERIRQGKVVTMGYAPHAISGAHAYVRTRRSGKPVLISLDRLTKVRPQADEVKP